MRLTPIVISLTLLFFPRLASTQTPADGEALLKKLGKGHPMVKGSLFGIGTNNPTAMVFVPDTKWGALAPKDRISIGLYAQSLIAKIRSNPDPYLLIPQSAPVYSAFRSRATSLCGDCFSIVIGPVKDSSTVIFDETVVQGDTPWQKDPSHFGKKWSEFVKQTVVPKSTVVPVSTKAAFAGYKTANPQMPKTSGALLFSSQQEVTNCFARAFGAPASGFSVCEPTAKRVLPAGIPLEILEKDNTTYAAKVRVLDGKDKGTVGYMHEAWITPSPWAR